MLKKEAACDPQKSQKAPAARPPALPWPSALYAPMSTGTKAELIELAGVLAQRKRKQHRAGGVRSTKAKKTPAARLPALPLLRFLLLLLADADLEVEDLGFLKRLVIVARHGVRKILVNIDVLRQDRHQGEIVVAGRAEGPEPLYIWNCHISVYFSRGAAAVD